MEVNRLNPTKSIRIEGISHFAFVNGWLLRSWGGVDVSQAVCRKRASVPVAQPPLLAPTVPRVDRDLSAAATGIRARRHGAARGEQPPECTSLKQTGLAYGCGDPHLFFGAPLRRSAFAGFLAEAIRPLRSRLIATIQPLEICLIAENRFVKTKSCSTGRKFASVPPRWF